MFFFGEEVDTDVELWGIVFEGWKSVEEVEGKNSKVIQMDKKRVGYR